MPARVRAVRGATTLDADTPDQVDARVGELVRAMLEQNRLSEDDLISMLFTATPDVRSAFPATAARRLGLSDVPLMGAQELDVHDGMSLCIRVMMHIESDLPRDQVAHVYLHRAATLQASGGREAAARGRQRAPAGAGDAGQPGADELGRP